METPRVFFARWMPTLLAFPIGGYFAVQTVGSIDGPLTAAAAGALAGAVIGLAQWLALRPFGLGPLWAVLTAVGMAAGSSLSAVLTGAGTDVQSLMLSGLVTGAVIGGTQAVVIGRGPLVSAAWTGVVGLAWALGWLTTSSIGVDVERGYAVFGLSGTLVATTLTGLVLARLVGSRGSRVTSIGREGAVA
jgi:hypothetical protein